MKESHYNMYMKNVETLDSTRLVLKSRLVIVINRKVCSAELE